MLRDLPAEVPGSCTVSPGNLASGGPSCRRPSCRRPSCRRPSCRSHPAGVILLEPSCWCHPAGAILPEPSCRSHPAGASSTSSLPNQLVELPACRILSLQNTQLAKPTCRISNFHVLNNSSYLGGDDCKFACSRPRLLQDTTPPGQDTLRP